MGWTYWHKPDTQSVLDAIREHYGAAWWDARVVATATTREALFPVLRVLEPDSATHVPDPDGHIRLIGVFLYKRARDYYNFGVKDITETMGPYGCHCPPSIIAKASPLRPLTDAEPEYSSLRSAHQYRAASLAAAEKAREARKRQDALKAGDKLDLGGSQFEAVAGNFRNRGRQISLAFRNLATGQLVALTTRQIGAATIIT